MTNNQKSKQNTLTGLHILGEMHAERTESLTEFSHIKENVSAYIEQVGLNQVDTAEYVFPEGGFTFVALLAESHVSIHTWPELQYVTIDVFVCNLTSDNSNAARELFDMISALFIPYDLIKREIVR